MKVEISQRNNHF